MITITSQGLGYYGLILNARSISGARMQVWDYIHPAWRSLPKGGRSLVRTLTDGERPGVQQRLRTLIGDDHSIVYQFGGWGYYCLGEIIDDQATATIFKESEGDE